MQAKRGAKWQHVLDATRDASCWGSGEQRIVRTRLRVQALAELNRFVECAAEGAGSADESTARRARFCGNALRK